MNDIDFDEFQIIFPVWTLATRDDAQVMLSEGQYGEYFPVFTDKDLAERYIDDHGHSDYVPAILENVRILRDYLKHALTKYGVQYVGFDVSKNRTTGDRVGIIEPIKGLLNHLADDAES